MSKFKIGVIGLFALTILFISLIGVFGQSFYGTPSTSGIHQSDFRNYYGSEIQTYWPILADKESCTARQDILLQVAPFGCQPSVVRSDLLAEQNVPVFCQIDALKVNPLLDIKEIETIRFSGQYPKEVAGTGFHPARAALRTYDKLLGSPLIDNIGYVVVVLKRQPNEREQPDFVNLTLTARIQYNAENAFGTGRAEFVLKPMSEEEWSAERSKSSFWRGKFYIRLDEADNERGVFSLYHGDQKFTSITLKRGETSRPIYVPGFYCQAGLQIAYDNYVAAQTSATLRVDNDVIEVYKGSRFLNNKCYVRDIKVGNRTRGESDIVNVNCGNQNVELKISARESNIEVEDTVHVEGDLRNWRVEGINRNNERVVSYNLIELLGENVAGAPEERTVMAENVLQASPDKIRDEQYDNEIEENFEKAISSYREVADKYPSERGRLAEEAEAFGEKALESAIELSAGLGKQYTQAQLINELLDKYPDSNNAEYYAQELSRLYRIDTSLAGERVDIDNKISRIFLASIKEAKQKPIARLSWGNINQRIDAELDKEYDVSGVGKITVTDIYADRARGYAICDGVSSNLPNRFSFDVEIGKEGDRICDRVLNLEEINAEKVARVRIIPSVNNADIETNLTVTVGIEKRAIELTPNKSLQRIETLNETINQWEGISNNLKKVIEPMKGACFATAGLLTAKNFLTGLTGEGIARQKVMKDYWTQECADKEFEGQSYSTINECYLRNSDAINRDVNAVKGALESTNQRVKQIESNHDRPVEGIGTLFGESIVDRNRSAHEFVDKDLVGNTVYSNYDITYRKNGQDVTKNVDEIFAGASYDNGDFGYDQARDVKFNIDIAQSSSASDGMKEAARKRLGDIARTVDENKQLSARVAAARADSAKGLPSFVGVQSENQKTVIAPVSNKDAITDSNIKGQFSSGVTHVAGLTLSGTTTEQGQFDSGAYLVGTENVDGNYVIKEVLHKDDDGIYRKVENTNGFLQAYNIGEIKSAETITYFNNYENPEVKYYETEPYKGMPAVVPFDTKKGWYAATKQTMPVFGGLGAFESSGRVASFWLCNVGENGREQFNEGLGDDTCQLINLNTGQPINQFPGLGNDEARRLVNTAIEAINDAARQHATGNRLISVRSFSGGTESISVGRPAANIPSTQCQDFHSPEDCLLMFNVCDPVICPASRCDLGGAFPVDDVIQTGIVGSALLCLPNIREGIAVPVCLTGVQAGIDSFVSILKSQQQCLQENIDSGRYTGICDELTAVYMCEFFWRQVAPAANVLLPKLVETATGQTAPRGGGEYNFVQGAWQQTQGSVNYFTQTYAVNSLDAFRVRSIEEAGTPICKAFISAKAPKTFEALVEPDSPPQFYAWFDSRTFNDATVPATAQYKVFYHIFAGNDIGTSYSIYLKEPPALSYYQTTPFVTVASGFIGKGQYKTETKDFTAPQGYRQLCVRINDKEECGFKSVSTDFALDYLKDKIASDEITQSNIISEQACISGNQNPATLLNPNIQSGLEETAFPEIYERGVVRICATNNPGSETDPTRFSDVGYCDDQRVRCWLDKSSIKNAISAGNKYLANETLSEVEELQKKALEENNVILPDQKVNEVITRYNEDVKTLDEARLGTGNSGVKAAAEELISEIDDTLDMAFRNDHKAELIFLRAKSYEIITMAIFKPIKKVAAPVSGSEADIILRDEGDSGLASESRPDSGVAGEESGRASTSEQEGQSIGTDSGSSITSESGPDIGVSAEEAGRSKFSLSKAYDPASGETVEILDDGQGTEILIKNNGVFLRDGEWAWFDKRLGVVDITGAIKFLPSARNDIFSLYNTLNDARLREGTTMIAINANVEQENPTFSLVRNGEKLEVYYKSYESEQPRYTKIYVNLSTENDFGFAILYDDSSLDDFAKNVGTMYKGNALSNQSEYQIGINNFYVSDEIFNDRSVTFEAIHGDIIVKNGEEYSFSKD